MRSVFSLDYIEPMKITFILPKYYREPIGGYLMVYEYANRLSRKGHEVVIVHGTSISLKDGPVRAAKNCVKLSLDILKKKLPPWYRLDPKVTFKIVPKLSGNYIPDGDIVVATWWATANIVAALTNAKGKKVYFIQHHEVFTDPEATVHATYSLPLKIITIAPFLVDIVKKECPTADVMLIPNSIDTSRFHPSVTIEKRNCVVGMLWSRHISKGVEYGLEALKMAKQSVPELEAILFGGGRVRPPELPDWVQFVGSVPNAQMAEIYNQCSLFLHTSYSEGWGLPPAEAMACGCCLVASANEGVTNFAKHNHNALLVPIKEGAALGHALIEAAKDQDLRVRLAKQAVEDMQAFSWEVGTELFERALNDASGKIANSAEDN